MKKKLNRYAFVCILLISIGIKAQETKPLIQSKLEGIVVDAVTKEPVIGASINIKGTTHGAVTDFDGKFYFQTGQKFPYTLVVSYMGYKRTEVVVTSNPVTVSITQEQNALSEVVVTALGITKEKKSLGYTTQSVKGKDLETTKETNFLNGLSGKLAGVRITNSQGDMGSSRIVIRGETSIAGNNQPLFVVDGIPVDNSQLGSVGGATRDFKNAIADLNPQDIESINVLKGPNAAALYGSRAAHGVVLITTKSGKGQQGLGVTVNTGITITEVSLLPTYQNTFGQGSNGKFSYVDGKGGGINDQTDESWGPKMDGRLIPQFNSNGVAVPFVAHPNNVKDYFNTGLTYDNSISVAKSDEKSDFRLGVNNQKQIGTVPNSEVTKTNFSVNANYKLSDRVKVGVTGNYIVTDAPTLPGGSIR